VHGASDDAGSTNVDRGGRVKRIILSVGLVLLLAGISTAAIQAPIAHGAAAQKRVCKTVTKKIHGKKKKVRVCHNVKTTSPPTSTNTPVPTRTPLPTDTPRPTITPVPINTPQPEIRTVDPSIFALSASDFSSQAQIVTSQVETNSQADAEKQIVHFGNLSWEQQGRVSGYFVTSTQMNMDSTGTRHVTLITYDVSIFGTADQAANVWTTQRDGWRLADPNQGSCTGNLGDPGYICADSYSATGGNSILLAAYFKRGRVLVQENLTASLDDERNNFYTVIIPMTTIVRHVLEKLDSIATNAPFNSVPQASIIPTAAPTATPFQSTNKSVLLDMEGSGQQTTQLFTTSGSEWTIGWAYDCSNFGNRGNFIINIQKQDGSYFAGGVNELGMSGNRVEYLHQGGTFYLSINSECNWHIRVVG
jgi:hypothetical protein